MKRTRLFVLLPGLVLLSACQLDYRRNSPDRLYSDDSSERSALRVPPDLTDISQGEQFVLPGNTGGAVRRNTLLPEFGNVQLQRGDGERWLRLNVTPEQLWPELVRFAQQERYRIAQTRPVYGVILTQWRQGGKDVGGLLQNKIGRDAAWSRLAFRLEREGDGTRLFARQQQVENEEQTRSNLAEWPPQSHDAESTSAMLVRLLVFLGIEEQRARGLMDAGQTQAVLETARLERDAEGVQLIIHSAVEPAFDAVQTVLGDLDYQLDGVDRSAGRLEAQATDSEARLVFELTPVHLSEARLNVYAAEGESLPASMQQLILDAVLGALS